MGQKPSFTPPAARLLRAESCNVAIFRARKNGLPGLRDDLGFTARSAFDRGPRGHFQATDLAARARKRNRYDSKNAAKFFRAPWAEQSLQAMPHLARAQTALVESLG